MSFELDPATLAAMIQEAKACFLDEDAPEYLQAFQEGLQQRQEADFTKLLRAAHSLKGGAGLAQLPSLRTLAHKLEDLLQTLQLEQGVKADEAWLLLEWGVTEVAMLLNQARTHDEVTADPALLQVLDAFAPPVLPTDTPPVTRRQPSSLIQTALTGDLEDCFTRLEQLSSQEEDVLASVETFYDECLLLGETLDIPWLVEAIEPLEIVLDSSQPDEAWQFAQEIITHLRSRRDQYLTELSTPIVVPPVEQPVEEKVALSHLRVPLQRLEGMTHQVEELIFVKERLRLQQQNLEQALRRLGKLSRQFEPIRDHVQTVYDQLAIVPLKASDRLNGEFDALELDRYSDLHTSLQGFQELMLRVQETRSDLDLVNREFTDDLEQVESRLDKLYNNVNDSRLVPFGLLARRFMPQIQSLNLRGGKTAELIIEGEDILVDQVLLEQLQIPLTHLLNNAFDHGIEPLAERLAAQKPEIAQIVLKASLESNYLVLQLTDDGRGIDCDRVYQQAKEQGLCRTEVSFEQLQQADILQWIFESEFSTAKTVSDLSGRGVGLAIVRAQVRRLRGSIGVTTQHRRGTCFTLQLPLNLSLQSLFLVSWQRRFLAIPTLSVLESLPYRELEWLSDDLPTILWRNQAVPVISLSHLLSYASPPLETVSPNVAMILNSAGGPLVVTVDALLNERQLIVKPFDDTVIVPPYLAGCTILGTGEVVPVLLPQAFEVSSVISRAHNDLAILPERQPPTIMVVEDSVATRRLLERLLTEVGCQVIACRDGQEAWDALPQYEGRLNLMISDIEMPRMNGFELLQKLRSDPAWHDLPVVMATSRTGERHRERAIALGVTAYLGKPIQPQALLSLLENLI